MKDQLISFKTAKLAEEKGFNIRTDYGFLVGTKQIVSYTYHILECYCPTQSLLQKWLREVHNIQVTVTYWGKEVRKLCNHSCYECIIHKDDISVTSYYSNSYEEALEEGLKQALQLIN